MKKYDFDQWIDRRGTQCLKWDQHFVTGSEAFYPLWVADMDFACCDVIVDALHNCVQEQIYGYSLGCDDEYKTCVVHWMKERFDYEIAKQDIFYCCGVVPALSYLIEILTNENDGIVIQPPVYFPFRRKIEARHRRVIENPLRNNNGIYSMDFDHLESLFKNDDVKGMILCSPHNPVGRVWKTEELLKLIELATIYDKWIISDEIHCDLVRENQKHIPLAKLAGKARNRIITCTAPSKTFNLAGLQVSNIIISDSEYQKRWKEYVIDQLGIVSPNVFAIRALKAAYGQGEVWLSQLKQYLDGNIEAVTKYLYQELSDAVVSPCEGTYLMWVDVSAYVKDPKILEQKMLEQGVVLDEGYVFGKEGACFERINVACPRAFLMKAMQAFVNAVKD